MASLIDLQNSFAGALLNGDLARLRHEFTAGTGDAGQRLGIFRNNTLISLTAALKATFPVTVQLADERFFAYAAHEFITGFPPQEARLSVYGAKFPAFLRTFGPSRGYPILSEMATLEWAIAGCLNSPERPPANPAILQDLQTGGDDISLLLQPNLKFLVSRWSILGVWTDHKTHGAEARAPLRREVTRIGVLRRDSDIQFLQLPDARFAFWRSLARGLPVNIAAHRALSRDPLFDLISETLLLFRMGLITGLNRLPLTASATGDHP